MATGKRVWSESAQALTRAAPTLITEGLSLDDVQGVRLTIVANSGQTFTGGGIDLYCWSDETKLWGFDPLITITIPNGKRVYTYPDFAGYARVGRMLAAFNAATVSGGTDAGVYLEAWTY